MSVVSLFVTWNRGMLQLGMSHVVALALALLTPCRVLALVAGSISFATQEVDWFSHHLYRKRALSRVQCVSVWQGCSYANRVVSSLGGENRTDRPTDRSKAYGTQKGIQSDSCWIRSQIWIVINGYGKGYDFTNIRSYPKIYHISRVWTISDKISDNELLSTWLGRT
jgi:hypothetical protein